MKKEQYVFLKNCREMVSEGKTDDKKPTKRHILKILILIIISCFLAACIVLFIIFGISKFCLKKILKKESPNFRIVNDFRKKGLFGIKQFLINSF